jgi:hypothetical protein
MSTTTRSSPHPRVLRRSSTLRSLRNVIEQMPVMSREFSALSAMSKDDMMATMDHSPSLSRRLDFKSREFAEASSRTFANNNNNNNNNININTSRGLGPIEDLAENENETGGGCCGGVWKSFDQDPTAKGYAIVSTCCSSECISEKSYFDGMGYFTQTGIRKCVRERDVFAILIPPPPLFMFHMYTVGSFSWYHLNVQCFF